MGADTYRAALDGYLRTIEGDLMHSRVHDEAAREKRGDTLILRGLSVFSHTLGLSGKCDAVEFTLAPDGAALIGETGTYRVFPIEYKRGKPKAHRADELQLCAQAMCLEEMLCCEILEGALFYGEPRRRTSVIFDSELRTLVSDCSAEMHALFARGVTPKVKPNKGCRACSLNELCMPKLMNVKSPQEYIKSRLSEEETD